MKRFIPLWTLSLSLLFFVTQDAIDATVTQDQLIVLPEARLHGINPDTDPFISLIACAKTEILMASYKLQKKKLPQNDLLEALQKATNRGVTVHLIAENRLTPEEILLDSNEVQEGDSLNAYKTIGVHVHFVSKPYNQSHTKFIIIDCETALLGTTNFDKDPEGHTHNQRPSRDFAVQTTNPKIIHELTQGFWSDIKNIDFEGHLLIWGPENQRTQFKHLIQKAKRSIQIYQQDITDSEMISLLKQAAKNGVSVELIMSPHPFGFNKPDHNITNQQALRDSGGHVFLTNNVNVHAKVLIIDGNVMYLGSTNFYQPAIDQNRNVGLLIQDLSLIQEIQKIFESDKQSAEPSQF